MNISIPHRLVDIQGFVEGALKGDDTAMYFALLALEEYRKEHPTTRLGRALANVSLEVPRDLRNRVLGSSLKAFADIAYQKHELWLLGELKDQAWVQFFFGLSPDEYVSIVMREEG